MTLSPCLFLTQHSLPCSGGAIKHRHQVNKKCKSCICLWFFLSQGVKIVFWGYLLLGLKGAWHEISDFSCFPLISFPLSPEYTIGAISIFYKNRGVIHNFGFFGVKVNSNPKAYQQKYIKKSKISCQTPFKPAIVNSILQYFRPTEKETAIIAVCILSDTFTKWTIYLFLNTVTYFYLCQCLLVKLLDLYLSYFVRHT